MTAIRAAAVIGLVGVMLSAGATARAQGLDAASLEALAATLRLLQDPSQRGALGSDAAAADQQVRALAGSPELAQEFYALAGEVFAELTRGMGGDAAKMTDAVARLKADPNSLAALVSPRTLDRIRELARKLSDQRR
jgi:hypothetical protein